ncbi:unnamed protein product [Prorocentrum cordatum]|uniref:ribonuclease H n=1 Tax=Prorocentrum cordatum TaxID=2364126 RepID=A0ABN9SVI0_9DINO|nr:unnamed protein product [Polarella glacialis]
MPGAVHYAVAGGPRPGVYGSWAEASLHATGQSGARCKKFTDPRLAEEFALQGPPGARAAARPLLQRSHSAPDTLAVPTPAGRTYLEVPFPEKDEAKALGAKWDPDQQKWFAEPGAGAAGVARWLPRRAAGGAERRPPEAAGVAQAYPAKPWRTYLQVPFKEKDAAKLVGARWDPDRRQWFVEPGTSLADVQQWIPAQGAGAAASHGREQRLELPPASRAAVYPVAAGPAAPPWALARRRAGSCPLLEPAAPRTGQERPPELALYTDGACKGNRNVATQSCAAGWGVAVVEPGQKGDGGEGQADDRCIVELYAPVVLDDASERFLGAEVGSNNTGELSAVCEALLWLRDHEHTGRPAVIFYDSKYAAMITMGVFNAQKNRLLAKVAVDLLKQVEKRRDIRLVHVKGHSGHRWNEAADRLANLGAAGHRCLSGRWAPSAEAGASAAVRRRRSAEAAGAEGAAESESPRGEKRRRREADAFCTVTADSMTHVAERGA